MKKVVLTLMTMMALLSTACQKSGGSSAANPIYPTCQYGQTVGCGPGGIYPPGGGAVNYGGTFTQNILNIQGNFQVSGTNPSGGPATLTGTLLFSQPWYCGPQVLMGQVPMTMMQQGQMSNGGVFQGTIMLGNIPAYVQIIPTQQPGTGNFAIQSNCLNTSFNF